MKRKCRNIKIENIKIENAKIKNVKIEYAKIKNVKSSLRNCSLSIIVFQTQI